MIPNAPGQRESPPPSGAKALAHPGKLKDASVSEVVQSECLAGSKRVVRVASGDDVGFLYFRSGSVVHAVTPTSSGEIAAVEMLGWSGATFEPVDREWPKKETISCTVQTLLRRAAQVLDEKEARSIVVRRGDGGDPRRTSKMDPAPIEEGIELAVTPLHVAGHTFRNEDVQLFLRMNREGGVVESHGGTPEFADVAAYALRLSQLVGDQLGLDRFASMECTFEQGRCFIVLQEDGDIVALEPRSAVDSSSLRELLGL
jgi:hypothetical protein